MLNNTLGFNLQDISGFKRKVELSMETEKYLVHTISTTKELEELLRLRYNVFYREIAGLDNESGIDFDEFDMTCDHIAVFDKAAGIYVATYRLNSTLYSDRFYSQTEFNMDSIMAAPEIKLEIGRACVHSDHRRGAVIVLLWRGIVKYMKKIEARFLLGCSSVNTTDPRLVAETTLIFRKLYPGAPQFHISPRPELAVPGIDEMDIRLPEDPLSRLKELIPPLFLSYLDAMSCRVCGDPALDPFFKCTDFLILLDRKNLMDITRKRYDL